MGWTRAQRTGPKPWWKGRNLSSGNEEINRINPACRNNIPVLSCSLLLRNHFWYRREGLKFFLLKLDDSINARSDSRVGALRWEWGIQVLIPSCEKCLYCAAGAFPKGEPGSLRCKHVLKWVPPRGPAHTPRCEVILSANPAKRGFTWISPKPRGWEGTAGWQKSLGWLNSHLSGQGLHSADFQGCRNIYHWHISADQRKLLLLSISGL